MDCWIRQTILLAIWSCSGSATICCPFDGNADLTAVEGWMRGMRRGNDKDRAQVAELPPELDGWRDGFEGLVPVVGFDSR